MRFAGRPGCRREDGSGAGAASSNANPESVQDKRQYSAVLMRSGYASRISKILTRAKHKESEKHCSTTLSGLPQDF